jgi:aminoglycoside phosphotransferase
MERLEKVIAQFKLKVERVEPILLESHSSEVYKIFLDNRLNVILKIPFIKGKLFRESKMLQRLSGLLPVPKVIDQWDGNEEISGALLLSYIDHDLCSYQEPTEQLSYQMGELLAKLHEVPMPGFGYDGEHVFIYNEQNDWWKFIKAKFDRILPNSEEYLPTNVFQKIIDYLFTFFMVHPRVDGPCVVHGDYRPGNILMKNNRITGLIDFESARGGSADFDFSKVKLYVWDRIPNARKEFEAGYQSIRLLPDLDKLLDFYILFHAVNHIDWCVKRGITGHEHFLNENINIVEKIVKGF